MSEHIQRALAILEKHEAMWATLRALRIPWILRVELKAKTRALIEHDRELARG